MDVIGIIVEYNPFHNGHIYHLNKIKELYKDSIIVAIMSSSFTQHGDVSIINKWDKTSIALKHGCDIVVELPYSFTCQSADVFSYFSIKVLNELKVSKIIFGSEINDIDYLTNIAKNITNNKEFDNKVKEYMGKGNSYPSSISKASSDILQKNISNPNDILGLCYIKEIIKNKYNIEPICIKRTNDYNDQKTSGIISSGTSIRECLKKDENINDYVPSDVLNCIYEINTIQNNYFKLLKYKILSSKDLSIYSLVDEGIENKIKKNILSVNNIDDLIQSVKSKRYTYSKLKRMFTNILVDYKKDDKRDEYIRILGFSELGKRHINKVKKEVSLPIYVTFNKDLEQEKRVCEIYSMIVNDDSLCEKEYKNKPIIK